MDGLSVKPRGPDPIGIEYAGRARKVFSRIALIYEHLGIQVFDVEVSNGVFFGRKEEIIFAMHHPPVYTYYLCARIYMQKDKTDPFNAYYACDEDLDSFEESLAHQSIKEIYEKFYEQFR